MKKLTFFGLLLTLIITMVSCKNDKNELVVLPKVSFSDAFYTLPKGCTQELRLLLEEPVATDTKFDVTFGGTAVKGTDFTTNVEFIEVKAGEKIGYILVTIPYETTVSKTIEVILSTLPTGYELGRFTTAKITTSLEQTTIFSFASKSDKLSADYINVSAVLKDQQGKSFRVTEATKIKVNPNNSSTAILGTHYRFKDGEDFISIPKNRDKGIVIIEFIKYEEGKDKIVLECTDKDGYFSGAAPEIVINIQPRIDKLIIGEWKGLGFYKKDDFARSWGFTDEQKALLPDVTATDIIKFNADGTMVVAMTGKLKNFLRNANYTLNSGSQECVLSYMLPKESVIAPICNLSVVNFDFATTDSDLKAGKVCLFFSSSTQYSEILNIHLYEFDNSNTDFNFTWGDKMTFQFIRK